MLVKFGQKGQQVSEYFLEDGSTLEDLLSMLNIDLGYDDIIHDSTDSDNVLTDNSLDHELEEGACYVLEAVELNDQEDNLITIINQRLDIDDLSVVEQKDLIQKIVKCVHEGSWDK